jgi:hypothetical protein
MLIRWRIISTNRLILIPYWIKILIPLVVRGAIFIYFISYIGNNFASKPSISTWFIRNIWFMPVFFRLALTQINLGNSSRFNKFVEFRWRETLFYKHFLNIFSERGIIKRFRVFTNLYVLKTVEIILIFLLIFLVLT